MSAAQVSIRPMIVADLERVAEIAQGLPQAPHWPRAAYLAALNPASAPHRIALAATASEASPLIGFLVANVLPPEAELETIAVAAGMQRCGVASSLLRALLAALESEGASTLSLEVRASNQAAVSFYRAHGFAQGPRRPRYYDHPEEDALLMRLDLP